MIVNQLIAELQELDQEAEVRLEVFKRGQYIWAKITDITVDDSGEILIEGEE